jgi:hypothetical protein
MTAWPRCLLHTFKSTLAKPFSHSVGKPLGKSAGLCRSWSGIHNGPNWLTRKI